MSEQPEVRLNFLDSEINPRLDEDFIGDSVLEPNPVVKYESLPVRFK